MKVITLQFKKSAKQKHFTVLMHFIQFRIKEIFKIYIILSIVSFHRKVQNLEY